MYEARYYKADGSQGTARKLPAELFDGVVNEAVLHRVVKGLLANQRQGTVTKKNRAAVRGGSRKPWRQKGTGRARQGTIRAAQWAGGGMAFPPQAHSWRQKVPKKVRALARRSAFNARAEADRVIVVDDLAFETPKTGDMVDLLHSLGLHDKVLILTHGVKPNVYLSARNLRGVAVCTFGEESAYDVLWAGTVMIERGALEEAGGSPAEPEPPETDSEERDDA